jgi:hypothetical protein
MRRLIVWCLVSSLLALAAGCGGPPTRPLETSAGSSPATAGQAAPPPPVLPKD